MATNLVTFAWAPFHSIKTSGLNFRQLPCSTEWNSIFAIYTQIFQSIIVKFSFRIQVCSRMSKFLVERFAFRKRFRKSGNFSGKILYQLPLFPKFLKFWVNGKRPKCIQEILVLRESSARTTTVSYTHLTLPTNREV